MNRIMSVSKRLLSLRGRMDVQDEQGNVIFEAVAEFAFLRPKWVLRDEKQILATFYKKRWSWTSSWTIESEIGDFTIKRLVWSWKRRYLVSGGPFDGAKVEGNGWDMKFSVAHKDTLIAQAATQVLTLRDRIQIELLDDRKAVVLFTAIVILILMQDKQGEAASTGG